MWIHNLLSLEHGKTTYISQKPLVLVILLKFFDVRFCVELFNNWVYVSIAKSKMAVARVVQCSSYHQHPMMVLIDNSHNYIMCHWINLKAVTKILNPCCLKNAYLQYLQNWKSLTSGTYPYFSIFFLPDGSHRICVNESGFTSIGLVVFLHKHCQICVDHL